MRFVSLNAWGGQCWPDLRDWLAGLNADVICLQEVIRSPAPTPDWLCYTDENRRLDQRPNLFDDVSAVLPDHVGTFAPAARGPLQDETGQRFETEHGLGLWVHRRHAVTALRHDFVFGTFRPNGWGSEPVPRSLQLARLFSKELSQAIVVGHFHGLRHPEGKADVPDRAVQTENAIRHLRAFREGGTACILAGDFNLLPDSAFFPAMADLGLHDQVTGRGFTDTRTSLYTKQQRYANYLLTSDHLNIRSLELPATPEVSDHRAMILDFTL